MSVKRGKRSLMAKYLLYLTAVVLVICNLVGGTLAWLISSAQLVNTFTVGNIRIDLTEEAGKDNNYEFVIERNTTQIAKDPVVTVNAGSEDCWLFVKLDASPEFASYLSYEIAGGWTELKDGIYYRKVQRDPDNAQPFAVLKGDGDVATSISPNGIVTVNPNLVKKDFDAMKSQNPTLTVSAYAIQQVGFDTVEAAWAEVSKQIPAPTP